MNPIEEQEFKWWLKANADILRKYSPDEIAYIARLADFSLETICKFVPEYHRDLQTRSTGKLREWWWVDRELAHIEEKSKPSLNEQWHRLTNYENGKDDQHD